MKHTYRSSDENIIRQSFIDRKVKITINRLRAIIRNKYETHDFWDDEWTTASIQGRNDAINEILTELDREEVAKAKLTKKQGLTFTYTEVIGLLNNQKKDDGGQYNQALDDAIANILSKAKEFKKAA